MPCSNKRWPIQIVSFWQMFLAASSKGSLPSVTWIISSSQAGIIEFNVNSNFLEIFWVFRLISRIPFWVTEIRSIVCQWAKIRNLYSYIRLILYGLLHIARPWLGSIVFSPSEFFGEVVYMRCSSFDLCSRRSMQQSFRFLSPMRFLPSYFSLYRTYGGWNNRDIG